MIRPNPIWRSVAVLGVAGLALTACGGSDGGTATQPTSSADTSSSAPAAAKGDGVLKVGTLLPQTGSLAFLGPPEFAGVDLALKDINDAGGVNGKPVEKVDSDSGDTSTDTASQSVDRLLSNKVDAIVGAASSSVSLSVIDKITGNGTLQISPANTSDELTNYDDKGLYFRTAPPDVLQGRVNGDLIASDGNTTLGILALQDSYGTGLADSVTKAFEGSGGQVVEKVVYDPKAASFATEVGKIKAADPEAIAVIAFDETKKIIPELVKQGIGPKTKKIYFVDGNLANYDKDFPKGTLTGVKGTLPGVAAGADFKKRLTTLKPDLTEFAYSPESYDATIVVALAAQAAGDDAGASIAAKMQDVSSGGEKCTSFQDCVALLKDKKDIDYDGVSGPIEFNAKGDPSQASIGIYSYGADSKYTFTEAKSGKI
ncbi:MAG: branched-chain amino acid transport system substrate-binding protein [Actinomycetota bacterium]|nr:branched-chain amino acid transport system substrate-binding protein [Actinomycetota bacterium]